MLNQQDFEQLAHRSKKVFFLYNLGTGEFDFLSGPVYEITELDIETIKKRPEALLDLAHPEEAEELQQQFQNLLRGTRSKIDCRLKHQDGTIRYIRVEAHPILDGAGGMTSLTGLAEDITRQVDYVNYLVEFGRKKNNMLEVVSHDLRGPLAIVRSVANLLQHDHQLQNYQELERYIGIINQACKECVTLINDLLDDEMLKSPTIVANKKRVNVVEKAQEVISLLLSVGTIPLDFKLEHAVEKLYVWVDETKFSQILNNLLSNAIKFTEAGGSIVVSLAQEDDSMLLKVADNGIGIPEEMHEHIFERHTEASREGLKGERSRGIGLSIVRDLVEVQGGKIWFESKKNQGSTFFVQLPMWD